MLILVTLVKCNGFIRPSYLHLQCACILGGSIANLYGLEMARFHKFPETREKGMQHLPKLMVFCSEQVNEASCNFSQLLVVCTSHT